MSTLEELARSHTALGPGAVDHLQRLVSAWSLLADLSFSDLLVFGPVAEPGDAGAPPSRFVTLGQIRPSTGQTLHRDDLVGRICDESDRPLVARAWRGAEIVEGDVAVEWGEHARVQSIPVRYQGELVAVLSRESLIAVGRRVVGDLERVYMATFDRLARMVLHGEFPFESEDIGTQGMPRVSDGAVLLDAGSRVEWMSPNAVNALHRLGQYANAAGASLAELGLEDLAVRAAYATGLPSSQEIEGTAEITVLLLCIPLLEHGTVSGALALLRDVSDVRRRDRLLLSKDATIREVHHRVKNNLQTISSLLRLQARRVEPGVGRTALQEAERRIRSIALVHEILSRDATDQVAFNEIVKPLVRMAEDVAFSPEHPIRFRVEGDAGELPAPVATPLAVVLNELLQNAVEHAFAGDGARDYGRVMVTLHHDGTCLTVEVRDDGRGFPAGFDLDSTDSLGLSIVRDLVRGQLGGTIDVATDGGAVVVLSIPTDEPAHELE